MAINWSDPNQRLSKYFTVKEAIWLPQWNRMATEKDGLGPVQKDNLIKLLRIMDDVRAACNRPVIVHVAFRSYSYNKLIGGAPLSSHVQGMAIDFHVKDMPCDDVRAFLLPKLESMGLRMEDLVGSSWVHLDIRPVTKGGVRFFKP